MANVEKYISPVLVMCASTKLHNVRFVGLICSRLSLETTISEIVIPPPNDNIFTYSHGHKGIRWPYNNIMAINCIFVMKDNNKG